MSWGERSCTGNGCRSHKVECEIQTCNVDCLGYEWDGKTKPDSISHKQVEKIATKEEAEIVGHSGKLNRHERRKLEKLNRTHF
jgi:hypothetical protein